MLFLLTLALLVKNTDERSWAWVFTELLLMSFLEEEQLPPSTGVGRGRAVPRAWAPLESSGGAYTTYQSNESMEDVDHYWSQGDGRSISDLAEENEKLKEDLMAMKIELTKYKHQVENRASPNSTHSKPRQSPDGSEGEEGSTCESELEIARQRIEELEQEVIMGKYLLEKQSLSPSMATPSQNSAHLGQSTAAVESELRQVRSRLEEVECDRDEVYSKLSGVKSELDMVKTERDKVKGEWNEVKGERDEIRGELEEVKTKLHSKEAELCVQNNGGVEEPGDHHVKEELDSTKEKLEMVAKTLEDTKSTLLCKEEELERAEQELEELRRKPTPRKRVDVLTVTKLERAMRELSCKTEVSLINIFHFPI